MNPIIYHPFEGELWARQSDIIQLLAENERLKSEKIYWNCKIHGQSQNAWGCPECVRELRGCVRELRDELAEARRLLIGCSNGNCIHRFNHDPKLPITDGNCICAHQIKAFLVRTMEGEK